MDIGNQQAKSIIVAFMCEDMYEEEKND